MADSVEQLRTALAGRYAIERELGRGGMATVYLAQDLRHKRRVALKVLDPELASALGPERFRREIETAAELQHPHVLPVFDSGEATGQLWYTMPYVKGESLRDRLIREGRLPIPEALRLAREIAEALDHAHRNGIVHRDVKPGNILLSEGHALVADFGIARHGARAAAGVAESPTSATLTGAEIAGFAAGATLTSTGISLGTPAYMSPEQALSTRDLDGRADQYALGCVLYEMLTGVAPYTGRSAQAVVGQHMTAPIPDVRAARPEVSAAVAEAVAKAMAKMPEARFGTGVEFAAALEATIPALPAAGPTHRLSRRRLLIGTVAVAAAATIGVGALLRSGSAPTLDEHLVAVAPFEVLAPDLGAWRERMADQLSRSLNGAGSLRAVAPTAAQRVWRGPADPTGATELGRRTRAGLAIYGQVLRMGRDSVRVVATVVDARRGTVIAQASGADVSEHLDRAADELAVNILQQVGSTQRIGRPAPGPLGSRSLAAVRAFLTGEQFYRRAMWDSAIGRYKEAIEADSTFTLADWHLGRVLSARDLEDPNAHLLWAGAHTRGLAPRDSSLVIADSIAAALRTSRLGLSPMVRLVVHVLDDAVQRYPEDPEAWYQLGQAHQEWGSTIGMPHAEVLRAFERAIALDSLFAPAYIPCIELKLGEGDPAAALRCFDRLLALGADLKPGTTAQGQRHLLLAAVRGATIDQDSVTADDLRDALWGTFLDWPDTGETILSMARAFLRKANTAWTQTGALEPAPGFTAATDVDFTARVLAYHGHLVEAARAMGYTLAGSPGDPPVLVEAALLGAIPAERVERALRPTPDEPIYTVRWWGVRGDTLRLRQLVARAKREEVNWPLVLEASAYLAIARHDTTKALQALVILTDSAYVNHRAGVLERARLLAATGALDGARLMYRRVGGWSPLTVIGRLELGELAERQGAREEAIESYQFVEAMWRHADPVLRPYVARARAGLARLTGEPRSRSAPGDRQRS